MKNTQMLHRNTKFMGNPRPKCPAQLLPAFNRYICTLIPIKDVR